MNEPFASTLNIASLLGSQPSAPLISPSSFVEEQEDEERLAEREKMIGLCRMLAWGPNPAGGDSYSFHMRCGHWREDESLPHCSYCLKERTTKFRLRGELCRDYLKENLGILQMDEEDFKKLARKFRKKFIAYWRIPVANLQVIVLFDATTCAELSTLEYEDLNWRSLCQTPKRKKYTGSLCHEKKEEVEKHDDDVLVTVTSFVVGDLANFQISTCWEEAMKHTDHLSPAFDEEEIHRACGQRMDVFETEIKEVGGRILHEVKRRMRVSSKSYSWNFNPDNMPTKENVEKRKVLEYDQAVAELFLL